ncbi:SIR2 family protein [Xenorhabdus szentirmaii]|uniref:SIR2 family protein n=1 Tax=Xenorhabdus szentirmaii TaxID=290112 RepID=UPI0019B4A2A4|nr:MULTISPECIES: SIR2 family protein [unclassified Xenorhabdus]MBD2782874.1 SIR2 family protein [Xenorhabdus sp. 38]MBD2806918.1 SIR2 family protein [Xenorhabdus sp. ZM]
MSDSIFNFKNYPIVFIGSGMSKRYLENSPTWPDLLEEYWNKINNNDQGFYNFLSEIKNKYKEDNNDSDLNHKVYSEAATFIEKKFNELFNSGKISLEGLTSKRVFDEDISPFKYSLCQRFKQNNLNKNIKKDEFESFKKFLKNAKMLITTNYDSFIETLLLEQNVEPKMYIGNEGFFDDTIGWSELYKIHGDIEHPNSIVINGHDYEIYDNKSILISAKILSSMIKSSIIFIGYSLTDRNVKKLLTDFSSQLPKEDKRKSAERIVFIEFKKDEMDIIKTHRTDDKSQITYTSIETDNYKIIYDEISNINEGLPPYDILRYQRVIKQLILNEGEKGNLGSLLVTPSDLDELERYANSGKNLVVALGDKQLVYIRVKEIEYLEDYIFEKNEIPNKSAIEFLIDYPPHARTPFSKLIRSCELKNINISKREIEKIVKRIKEHGKIDKLIKSVHLDKKYSKTNFNSIEAIKSENLLKNKELLIIIKNIKSINKDELKKYIQEEAFALFKNENLKSDLRKLFLAFDLLMYGDVSLDLLTQGN